MSIPTWDPSDPAVLQIQEQAANWWGGVTYRYTLPISSVYGWRTDPYFGGRKFHTGIDIPLQVGTPVLAVFAGVIGKIDVAGIGAGQVNGNCVELRVGPFSFYYLHLSAVNVKSGQQVDQADILGLVGMTGAATGPHLHFQCYYLGKTIDPMIMFPGRLFR